MIASTEPVLIQMSLFELDEGTKKDTEVEKIRYVLMSGSGYQNGKQRIYDFGITNPSVSDFSKMLKNEYGIGGSSMWEHGITFKTYDNKGIKLSCENDAGDRSETLVPWTKAAQMILEMIQEGRYLRK